MSHEIAVYHLGAAFIQTAEGGAKFEVSHRVTFLANSHADALDAMMRHLANRKRAVPEYFGELGSVRVSTKTIGEIDRAGLLTGATHMDFFEWKHDFPGTLGEYLEMAREKLGRREPWKH